MNFFMKSTLHSVYFLPHFPTRYFSHLFNTEENKNYVVPYLDKKNYSLEYMSTKNLEDFSTLV